MALDDAIATSAKWLNECNARLDGAPINASYRNRVSAGLLHLSLTSWGDSTPNLEQTSPALWFGSCSTSSAIRGFRTRRLVSSLRERASID